MDDKRGELSLTEHILRYLIQIPGEWAFALSMLFLLICSLGFPLPVGIPLLASAYFAYREVLSLEWAIGLPIVIILVGDTALFWLGRHFGPRVYELPVMRTVVTRRRLRKANVYFKRWGSRVVFMGRFMAGIRTTVFLMAAILNMPFRRFFWLNLSAVILSVPLHIFAMYALLVLWGEDLHAVLSASRDLGHGTLMVITVAVVGVSLWAYFRRPKHRRRFGSRSN